MTIPAEERNAIIVYRIEKSRQTMREALQIANLDHWNLVANRLYYACYYIRTALLLSR